MNRSLAALRAATLLLAALAFLSACQATPGYNGPPYRSSYFGSQTIAGMTPGGPPTASAGGNSVH